MTTPPRTPEWIGHRGAPREHAENTLPSFERAIELGADAVELDVHATADGIVVVHHDPVLSRAAPGEPARLAIDATPWLTLRGIELQPGVKIPTLAQVLDLVGRRARVYVEIKGARIEALVVDVIRRSSADCAVHSFDHDVVARVGALAPELPRGILFDEHPADVLGAMRRVSARDVWPQWRLIGQDLVTAVHGAGGRVIAWTVNAANDAARLEEIGVDGICSDDLRQLAGRRV